MAAKDFSTPSARYRWLIEQMGDELGRGRGWKKRVAEQLGVHPSYISKFLKGDIEHVGIDVIERAIGSLMLNRALFFEPELDLSEFSTWHAFQHVTQERTVSPAGTVGTRRVERFDVITMGRLWQPVRDQVERILQLDRGRMPVESAEGRRLARALWEVPAIRSAVLILAASPDAPLTREEIVLFAVKTKELEMAIVDADRYQLARDQEAIERAAQNVAAGEKSEPGRD